MVLISLLVKCFVDNLFSFRNHLIYFSKHDVLNIQSINFDNQYSRVNLTSSISSTIDLSKLEVLSKFRLGFMINS